MWTTDRVRALLLRQQGPDAEPLAAQLRDDMTWTEVAFDPGRLQQMVAIHAPIWATLTADTGRLCTLVAPPEDDEARAHYTQIATMAAALDAGRLDRIIVVTDDAGTELVIDGNHRVAAALERQRRGLAVPSLPGLLGRTAGRLYVWGQG